MLSLIGLINIMVSFTVFGIIASLPQFDGFRFQKLTTSLFIYTMCSPLMFLILAFIQEGVCK